MKSIVTQTLERSRSRLQALDGTGKPSEERLISKGWMTALKREGATDLKPRKLKHFFERAAAAAR